MVGALQFLLSTGGATGAGTGAAAGAGQADGGGVASDQGGGHFAQLLNDAGTGGGQNLPFFTRGGGQGAATLTAGALLAQDVGVAGDEAAAMTPQQLLAAFGQASVTQENAPILLERLNKAMALTDAEGGKAVLTQLQQQVEKIAAGGAPQTVAQLLASVPESAEKTAQLPQLVAMLQPEHAAEKTDDKALSPAMLAAAMQAMPAAMFRAADAKAPGEAKGKAHEEKTTEAVSATDGAASDTVLQFTPLAYTGVVTLVQPQAVQSSTVQTIPPEELDAAIPPLALQPQAQALPKVSLPDLHTAARNALVDHEAGKKSDDKNAPIASATSKTGEATAEAASTAAPVLTASSSAAATVDAGAALIAAHKAANAVHAPLTLTNSASLIPPGYVNHAPVSEQVKVSIHQAKDTGMDRVTIQLDPVELGRVEVNLQRGSDGHSQITFTVDKPETFDQLSRDARLLERSLQEAGIKADAGSMQFNLRQQPQPQMGNGTGGERQPGQQASNEASENEGVAPVGSTSLHVAAASTRNYLLNLREGVDISA